MTDHSLLHNKFSFSNQDLIQGLPKSIVTILEANTKTIQFLAGTTIFQEGESPTGIFRVKKGKVKKFTTTNFGTQHLFYICREDEYLGYHALLSEELYADTATALTASEIEYIPKKDFLKAIDASHLLSQRLLRSLSHEFGVFINATKLLAKYTVRERSALNLLILEDKFRLASEVEVEIKINRDDLSNMVGTAKESLVRMLKDFKDEKLISTNGRSIFIKDYEGLLKVSNSV
ncbi:Transcriptional activator protein Anr [Kordia antarctica]|uniref:Transcriptional activator protein Anr n=1 Tax=Kordia antarctica TaxID=1218801 RepID=A0A7L4ZHZ3_9FLAO|nr:Crp/Fnr family transcriptional regulator [Kordia antarctica]QHI36252.1 Transcriptional activator protein Anr [Kordia antarctica]